MTKETNEKIFKMMNALFIAGIVVASIFVGYIHYPASKGTITDKSFVAAEYEIKEETNFLFVGKVPISRNKDYIYEYPDSYILTITEERLFNRKIKSNIYVTKATYNSVKIGDEYKFCTNTDTYMVPYKKYQYIEGTTPLPEIPYKSSD